MSKHKVVIFTKHNARILNNPHPRMYRKYPNAVIDPDLTRVARLPPHLWKLQDGQVVPMNPSEQKRRLKQIADIIKYEGQDKLDNEIRPLLPRQIKPSRVSAYSLRAALVFMALLYGSMFLVLEHERVWRTLNEIGVIAFLQKALP